MLAEDFWSETKDFITHSKAVTRVYHIFRVGSPFLPSPMKATQKAHHFKPSHTEGYITGEEH